MAFPWIFESNFEVGDNTEWDSETDTGSKLSIAHFSTLANIPGSAMPYRGAYAMLVDLRSGDTNDHTLTEGDIDIADAATRYFRFYLHASKDFTATADDVFNIFELQQVGGTVESSLGMQITAASNLLEIGIGDGTAPTTFVTFPRGRWVCVELLATISTGGAGVLTLFLDGSQVATLTTLTNAAAVGQGVLGTQNTLSTTTGCLVFDQFVMDDARIYPISQRWPEEVLLTKSGHVFVGPGYIENATLLSGAGTDCVLSVYDTDQAKTLDASNVKLELKNVANNDPVDPAGVPVQLNRGCYVVLSGTTPRAMIKVSRTQVYGSEGRIRQYGMERRNTPGGW